MQNRTHATPSGSASLGKQELLQDRRPRKLGVQNYTTADPVSDMIDIISTTWLEKLAIT